MPAAAGPTAVKIWGSEAPGQGEEGQGKRMTGEGSGVSKIRGVRRQDQREVVERK